VLHKNANDFLSTLRIVAVVCILTMIMNGCSGNNATNAASPVATPAVVIITPSQTSVPTGGSATFIATQGGSPSTGGQWAVVGGSANGSINSAGLYNAPTTAPNPAAVLISYQVATKQYTASITITGSPIPAPTLTVMPAMLVGGSITLTLTGTGFSSGDITLLGGQPMQTTVISPTKIVATGFLKPWTTGSVVVEVTMQDGISPLISASVPIAPTAVTYDAAARFATQAAFGPRPDLVLHIQQIGLSAFLTEQFQQPGIVYPIVAGTNNEGPRTFMTNAISGNTLLRQRVAYALQTFMVEEAFDFDPANTILETTLENDASGNFRQLMTDITSSPNVATFLNLPNNNASSNPNNQPNQNFAREIMQLFCLGPQLLNDDGSLQLDANQNPIPTYSQDTVLGMTRALTGWQYSKPVNPSATAWGIDFSQPLTPNDGDHDFGAKTLFGTVSLAAGQDTVEDRGMALDAIFNHPNLPPFISRMLIMQLVTSNPSPAYIQRVATVFENDGTGVRGNMTAVIRAILLDAEARSGDTTPSPNDGIFQSPIKFQMFAMTALQDPGSDDQALYMPQTIGESLWSSPTVFYFFSPSYVVPGTSTHSPEFMLFNNLSSSHRSRILWGIISSQQAGYTNDYKPGSWLFTNFTTVPTMVDALNHLLYHGQMSQVEQAAIISYCSQIGSSNMNTQLESAIFLAMNGDSYNVSQ
jgi:hypothetical protein